VQEKPDCRNLGCCPQTKILHFSNAHLKRDFDRGQSGYKWNADALGQNMNSDGHDLHIDFQSTVLQDAVMNEYQE
jgi:hypothetical protein